MASKTKKREDNYIDLTRKIGARNIKSGFRLRIATKQQLAALYVGNGLAKRYIDLICDDMTRQWISIPEDTDNQILNYLNKINAKKKFKEALRASKLFGGSLIWMVIDDGKEPNEAVNINNINSIQKLQPVNKSKISIQPGNYYNDPTLPNYNEPRYYTILDGGKETTLHESRCLIFKGEYLPQNELALWTDSNDEYWGLSALQAIHEDLEQYGLAEQALYSLLIKANVDTLKIEGLMDKLRNVDGKKQLDARLAIHDEAKSICNTLLIDAKEDYYTVSQQLTGIADLFSKLQDNIAGVTGVPSTILFGTSAKGLNATGDNEVRSYYDNIKSEQEEILLPPLQKLVNYITLAKDGVAIKEPAIEFNSLWQQTEEQIIKNRSEQAKIDEIYIANGVLSPEEVRKSRFGNDKYSIETTIEEDIELPEEQEGPKPEDDIEND